MQKKWLKTTFFAIESQYEAFATQVPEIQPGPLLNVYPLSLDVLDICFEYKRLYYFGAFFFFLWKFLVFGVRIYLFI